MTDDAGAARLHVGDEAPPFRIATLEGGSTTLDALLGGRHLVLLFMREFT